MWRQEEAVSIEHELWAKMLAYIYSDTHTHTHTQISGILLANKVCLKVFAAKVSPGFWTLGCGILYRLWTGLEHICFNISLWPRACMKCEIRMNAQHLHGLFA